ncbi:MAG: T9SS type A sorting domain-containing protein, partial [Bacteroidales bacterium]
IDAGSITHLNIDSNQNLTICAVQSICDYLTSPSGIVDIHDNAIGCNNQAEVEAACAILSVNNINNEEKFSIYPNPASTIITIETTEIYTKSQLSIVNVNGQELITHQIIEPKTQVDISNLPSGVYFVRLTNDRNVTMGKFIKN